MIAEIFISLCLAQDWKRKGKQEKRGHPAVILINHCKIACLNSNPCAWENVMKWLNFEQRSPLRWSVLKQETLRYKWVPKTNTLRLVRTCQSNASGVQTQLKCKRKHSWPQGLGLFFLFVCLFFGPGGGALNTNACANCKDYYARMGICSGFFFRDDWVTTLSVCNVHAWNNIKCKRREKNKETEISRGKFLHVLSVSLRSGSSHVCLVVLALAFALSWASLALSWTSFTAFYLTP